ncbi:MAG: FTR1 family protein [Actinobacteria bacterium]|nr:FTR1 family protein [Actinomycetota bacterium]
MLSNYLIGLREGLEAALIVAILVAYLVRTGNAHAVSRVWQGVAAAVGVSIVLGVVLVLIEDSLEETVEPAFAGVMSLIAVGLITWMVFWMASRAKGISAHLHGEVDRALATSTVAVAIVAFVAVLREGAETALFLWAGINAAGSTAGPLFGAVLGLLTAVALGVIVYKGAVRLNLGRLFTWTGAALIIVAGGVLRYAVHEFQEIGWLPGEDNIAFDVSGTFPADGIPATLVRGFFNLVPTMTWLEVVAWFAYVVPTLIVFIVMIRRRGAAPATKPAAQEAVVSN